MPEEKDVPSTNPRFFTRLHALGIFSLGLAGILINIWMMKTQGKYYVTGWLGGPALLLVGFAGLIDPRILPVTDKNKGLINPGWALWFVICAIVGFGIGIWLAFFAFK